MIPSIQSKKKRYTPKELEREKQAYERKRSELIQGLGGKCIKCGMPYPHLLQIRIWYGDNPKSAIPGERPYPTMIRGRTMARLRQQEQLIKERNASLLCRWCMSDDHKAPIPHRLNPLNRPWHLVTFYCMRCDALVYLKDTVRGKGDQLCCCQACARSTADVKETPACGCKDLADDPKFMPPYLYPENCTLPEYDRATFYRMRHGEGFQEYMQRVETIEKYFVLWDLQEAYIRTPAAPADAKMFLTEEMREICNSSYWRLLRDEWAWEWDYRWSEDPKLGFELADLGHKPSPVPTQREMTDPYDLPPEDFKERFPGYVQKCISPPSYSMKWDPKKLADSYLPAQKTILRVDTIANRVTGAYMDLEYFSPPKPKRTDKYSWLKNRDF